MRLLIFILFSFSLQAGIKYQLKADRDMLILAEYYAFSQLGLNELTGNNDGPHIEEYLKSVGLNPKGRFPYCAAGIYWCFLQAQIKLKSLGYDVAIPIKRTASANAIFDDAKSRGKKINYMPPTRGDLLVWKLLNSYSGHIEMVIMNINNIHVRTIGFNTSSGVKGSQSNGGTIAIKIRSVFDNIGRLNVRGLIGFSYE